MVEDGASPVTISNELYFSASYASVKLRASALSAITLEHGGKIGFLSLPVDVLKESGANESDSEGLVDEVRSIVGTVAGIFMRELESNRWKLSLRSKDPKIDVNKVAGHFSGGGHAAAAGCTILGSEAEVKSKILAQMAHEVDSSI